MDIGRMMPSTLVSDWSRNYIKAPKFKPALTLSNAVSGLTTWTSDNGKLYITNASTSSNTLSPNGDFNIKVKIWGAGGGRSSSTSGAGGGYTEVIVPCSLGTNIICAVGGGGSYVPDAWGATSAGGVNGGGRGYRAGDGGGFSGIFRNTYSFANAIAIAGGGGGGGHYGEEGGAGGGTTGQDGLGSTPGYGAGQTYGGTGSNQGGQTGGQLYGGDGAGDWGPGGGGGYYGGGGGGETPGQVSGAGGGSGYFSTTWCLSGLTAQGNRTTPANSSDSDRGTYGNSSVGGLIVVEIL